MKRLSHLGERGAAGEEHSSLAQWDQDGFNEQLMGPRLGRVTDRTGKFFLRQCLLVEGQLHYLGKSYLAESQFQSIQKLTEQTNAW